MLTNNEKNILLSKIGRYIAELLRQLKEGGVYTYKEIADKAHVVPPRISEILKRKAINEPTLVSLLKGGIVNTEMIKTQTKNLTDKEKKYLDDLEWLEGGFDIKKKMMDLKRLGVDLSAALDEIIEKAKEAK